MTDDRWKIHPSLIGDTLDLPPTQDSSDHQDDITFLVGNPYKPSFATVTGWGVDPRDTSTQILVFPASHVSFFGV